MNEVLYDCPFCGDEAKMEKKQKGIYEFYYIECTGCRATVGGYDNKESTIKNWNMRIPMGV